MNLPASYFQTFFYLIIAYLILTLLFYFASNSLMYFPPKSAPLAKEAGLFQLTLSDNTKVNAVYLPNPNASYTILFSHGNAEDLSLLYPFLKMYQTQGYAILAYDYPGYGGSEGKPSEKSTYDAILSAYRYLTQARHISPDKIVIHGRSLGCGPSIHLASLAPIGALILESPFVSAYRVQTMLPLFPFDKYKNLDKIRHITVPTLIIHGKKDKVIPFWHGKKIYQALKGYKKAYWVENAGHNDILLYAGDYWSTIRQFLKQKP